MSSKNTYYHYNSTSDPITVDQIKLIKIAQKELGIEDDDYREMLRAHFRVTSCTQLTKAQATKLIERFRSLGFETKNGLTQSRGGAEKEVKKKEPSLRVSASPRARSGISRDSGKVIRLASAEELKKISTLASLIEWDFEDGLSRWMQKRFGMEKVRTAKEAWLVIEGLKKMFSNAMAKKHGKAWWTYSFKDQRVMRFIQEHGPKQ